MENTIANNKDEDQVWKEKMENTITKVGNSIMLVGKSVVNLSVKWKNMEPVWNAGGRTFEIAVRENLRRKFGDDFVRPFDATSLIGLARLSLPKGYRLPSETSNEFSSRDSAFRMQSRTDTLVVIARGVICQDYKIGCKKM
jgi:hypothetical protein